MTKGPKALGFGHEHDTAGDDDPPGGHDHGHRGAGDHQASAHAHRRHPRPCSEIETAVRQVVGGNTIGGGLRLLRAINTYGDAADPTVVTPARRMASAGVNGDLEASAAATQEATAACRRLGFPVNLPGPVQCVTNPCP